MRGSKTENISTLPPVHAGHGNSQKAPSGASLRGLSVVCATQRSGLRVGVPTLAPVCVGKTLADQAHGVCNQAASATRHVGCPPLQFRSWSRQYGLATAGMVEVPDCDPRGSVNWQRQCSGQKPQDGVGACSTP